MNNSYFSRRVKQLSALVFLLIFVTAVKAQNPVTLSYSLVDQTAANTIQEYLNNGQDVILTSTYDITISKQTFRTGGAHELSLIYAISSKKHTRKPSHYRNLPCPSFFNKVLAH